MSPIIDPDPTPLMEAVEENLVEQVSFVQRRLAGMNVDARDDLVLVDSGLGSDTFNKILAAAAVAALILSCENGTKGGAPDSMAPDSTVTDTALEDAAADSGLVDPKALGLTAICPGAKGCASSKGDLFAGAASVVISPKAFESPRSSYLIEKDYCPPPTPAAPFGLKRCGQLVNGASTARKDCGLDGLCQGDNLKTRLDCDSGTPCPAPLTCETVKGHCMLTYQKPDADSSEDDGMQDWFLDCGGDRICPCKDPSGYPAYFGKDKKTCLVGHTKNQAYTAPDADGSEGNGVFEAIWMGGFNNNHPLLGHHDDIWARALVLRTGDTTVAVLSLDLVGLFFDDVEKIRAAVAAQAAKHGFDIDYLLVSSTHNHEGPDTMGQWGPGAGGLPLKTGVDKAYMQQLIDGAAKAVTQAAGTIKKATLVAAQARTGAQGLIRDNRDPQVIMDELVVLQLRDAAGGKPMATLVSWSNHPEALSDINNYLTSDFSHYLREGLEQKIPAVGSHPELPAVPGVAIYLQGAVGCLMTPLGLKVTARDGTIKKHGWEKAEALGINVAVKAREALKKAETIGAPELSLWAKQVRLPVENTVFQLAFTMKILDRKLVDYDAKKPPSASNMPKVVTEIAVIRLGPVTFYSVPGEIAPEILVGGFDGSRSFGAPIVSKDNNNPPQLSKAPKGPYLASRIPGKYKIIVGLGNDELGYIVPEWNFLLGSPAYMSQAEGDHYEETNSLGPKTEPLLLKAYDELLKHMPKN